MTNEFFAGEGACGPHGWSRERLDAALRDESSSGSFHSHSLPFGKPQGCSWSVRMTGVKGMDDLLRGQFAARGPAAQGRFFLLAYPPFSASHSHPNAQKTARVGDPVARLQGGLNNVAPAALVHRGCNRDRYLYCRAHSKSVFKRTP